jgi:S-adenosylmethionine:tRNA ribosyltransferase-isomerase
VNLRTDDFDYHLPEELIAQTPLPRGESRLLVLHRRDNRVQLRRFPDILEYLHPGDTLVLNNTRVTARRVYGRRDNGRPVEALLMRPFGEREWEALLKPARPLCVGSRITLLTSDQTPIIAEVTAATPEGGRRLLFADQATRDRLALEGEAPLPPYIHQRLQDEERYQTVYSGPGGSAAAPTAGLHFTSEMLEEIERRGVGIAKLTLHVGIDTFRPVREENPQEHAMHGEWYTISPETAEQINATKGRVIAVGTTTARALESAAVAPRRVEPTTAVTRLFILPGYSFQIVEALLTNFHLPKSTLLMMVSALATREQILDAYRQAVAARFRFYSFGDAMLIV